jgi:hypothetical protein
MCAGRQSVNTNGTGERARRGASAREKRRDGTGCASVCGPIRVIRSRGVGEFDGTWCETQWGWKWL